MEINNFLFRRQFILGPDNMVDLPGWKRILVNDKLYLATHPDLPVSRAWTDKVSLIMLGFMLDPFNPFADDTQILREMIRSVSKTEDVFREVAKKSGRFILIVRIENTLIMFSDAAGFRQIFYYKDDGHNLWCASQPSLLVEHCKVSVKEEVLTDLSNLSLFRTTTEYWFPGNITSYKGVFHLTPNHYLNLYTGDVVRYWPTEHLRSVSLDECVKKCSMILQGILEGACSRFDTGFAITAGLDTRVLLSATRNIRDKIHFFTHTHAGLTQNGADIKIPEAMLKDRGLKHHIAYHQDEMSKDFEEIFRRNVTQARNRMGINTQTIYQHFQKIGRELLVINGVCSELTRNFYRFPKFFQRNGSRLATLADMRGSKIATEAFESWLRLAKITEQCGIRLLDLFYWENRNANWAAMSYSEYDLAFDSLSPFNCRALLELMLGVENKYRLPPKYMLHIHLIRNMWPELLRYPINPSESRREALVSKIRGTMLYDNIKFLKFLRWHYLGC
jgi:hypothetical protein